MHPRKLYIIYESWSEAVPIISYCQSISCDKREGSAGGGGGRGKGREGLRQEAFPAIHLRYFDLCANGIHCSRELSELLPLLQNKKKKIKAITS